MAEARREKEKEREVLENQWRASNDDYKHMQELQKRLRSQNKEHQLDLLHLKQKIKQFSNDLTTLKSKKQTSS